MADREEVQIDQATFDKAIAEGKPERVARAIAKSAWVRKTRGPAGPGVKKEAAAAAAPAEGAAPAAAAAGAPAMAGGVAPTATAVIERLTPEQRAARVAAATGRKAKDNGGGGRAGEEVHRLLAVVPPEGIQRVVKRQDDKVNVWPHLLLIEFLSILVGTVVLVIMSTFIDAPFLKLANPSLTPNPSKAPWYFMGLQELLRYFHPMIAGVTIPGLGLIGLMALPYVDKNPSMQPDRRKLAIITFTIFMMFWCVLVIIGSFFRGPGYNFVYPWTSGLYFDF